ncbi:MAG TPA: amidohydrolase [Burkholderiales bacterium]|nr:amidohydrolase [Burkholderiales bacterium]
MNGCERKISIAGVTRFFGAAAVLACVTVAAQADTDTLEAQIRKRAAAVEQKLIAWRRDIHQHPELGDQETRTSELVARHLRALGLEVRTGVARTGVVGILKGGRPGRTVALRADMDALPVKEPPGLPFASQAKGKTGGQEVDVMHACGHDAHTAMLMAAAEVLAGMRKTLPGTVMFIFQPAEEGSSVVPPGQSWGAKLMLEEGLFKQTKPDAVFAVHVMPGPSGELSYRTGATAASSDFLDITTTGRQGHGGMPWNTVDPITTSAFMISGLQTVVSRRANLTTSPAVVTIGMINGGTGPNIVPETVQMRGTIRTYADATRRQVHEDIRLAAVNIAESAGASAAVKITPNYDVTVNDEALAKRMAPVLKRAADGRVSEAPLAGASEDFSFFAKETPGLYVFLGVTPRDQDPAKAAPNHNPRFFVDESALVVGTRTLAFLAVNVLASPATAETQRHARQFIQEER